MNFSDNAMTAILLCSYLGISNEDTLKPLTMKEWNEFLDNVTQHGEQPSVVIHSDTNFFKETGYNQEFTERMKKLLSRGGAIAFALDELTKKGIDIVTLFDHDYPKLLKRKLKRKSPPVLFYSGDISLAQKIGIGIAGSRNIDEDGIRFTQKLVEKAASERLIIYSGGAKGIDSTSEKAAVESGSAAVSFIADSLLSKIRKKDILDSIINKKLLLFSDVKPDVGFSAARAMNRNKYIYASSYGTFVVASDYNKGGTWTGAAEALKKEWTKVFVWNHKEYNGNQKLIEKGGIPYVLSESSIFERITKTEENFQQMDLFSFASKQENIQKSSIQEIENKNEEFEKQHVLTNSTDLYPIIAPYIVEHIGEGMTKDEAAETFHVAKGQMTIWLKQLCKDSQLQYVNGRYTTLPSLR